MKKKIGTVFTPTNSFGIVGMEKNSVFAEYELDFKVRYQTVMGYWKSANYKTMTVRAKSEQEAELKVSAILQDGKDIELLKNQIYDIQAKALRGSDVFTGVTSSLFRSSWKACV